MLAALDRPFQEKMRAERLPYFNFHEGSTRDLRSNVSAFRALGALKGELVLRVLAARRHVLLSDVDVIWLRDPRALLLDRALGAADVMVATDCLSPTDDDDKTPRPKGANRCAYGPANVHGHAAFNTGVLFFRATAAARVVAAAWRHRLLSEEKNKWLDDQVRNSGTQFGRNSCAQFSHFLRNSLTRFRPSHGHSSRSTSSFGMASACTTTAPSRPPCPTAA